MKFYKFHVDRAICPGCGASLNLKGFQAIVVCVYCGSECKVERRLRKIEPDIRRPPQPADKGNPQKDYDYWNAEQLINRIINETDAEEKIKMAEALDQWGHVNLANTLWIPVIIEIMLKSQPALDRALSGILGKMICSDDLKIKRAVISAGEQYGFNIKGSKGLLFALSLGDAGTVKLLLDIAEWSAKQNALDYSKEALLGVQTAIGRDSERLRVCMEILLYRFLYVSSFVRQWMGDFLRNHFDVGYTFLYCEMLELMEDCYHQSPDSLPLLENALKKCRSAKNMEELRDRLTVFQFLKCEPVIISALNTLGPPPGDMTEENVQEVVDALSPLLDDRHNGEPLYDSAHSRNSGYSAPSLRETVGKALSAFVWVGEGVPGSIESLIDTLEQDSPDKIPQSLKYSYNLRKS